MFQTYEDKEGRVDVVLLDNGVVYARLEGGLSARVGTMYASYLDTAPSGKVERSNGETAFR